MDSLLRRFTILAVSLLAATIVVVAGVAFLCGALYLALLAVATPPLAALATGLVAFAIALLILIAGDLFAGRRHSASGRHGGMRDGRPTLAMELGNLAGDEIGKLARKHPAAALLVSLLAGFAVGFSPQLRKALRDLIER
ncbi:MAG TPA: hypothetical protein VEJ16_02910 [Alphaproteobacteria bacterium]|nr:hypothetical protein [Alphaproteobacteria bacterium]